MYKSVYKVKNAVTQKRDQTEKHVWKRHVIPVAKNEQQKRENGYQKVEKEIRAFEQSKVARLIDGRKIRRDGNKRDRNADCKNML